MQKRFRSLALLVLALGSLLVAGGCGSAPQATPQPEPQARPQPAPPIPLLDQLMPLAVSPDGARVALGLDGLTLYDQSGAETLVTTGDKKIRSLHWSPGGRWLLANAAGPTLLLIEPSTGGVTDLTDRFPGLQDSKLAVSWSPDESKALLGEGSLTTDQSSVWLLDPEARTAKQVTTAAKLAEVQWLQGGKGLLQVSAGCCGPMNLFFHLADGTRLPDEDFSGGGSIAPDRRRFALAPYMGATLTIRDLVDGSSRTIWRDVPPGDPPLPEGAIYRMSPGIWSPDGRHLALVIETWSPNSTEPVRTLRIVDTTDGTQVKLVRDWAPSMAWLPESGDLLYAAKAGQQLRIHLGDRLLSTHDGGTALGTGPIDQIGVISPDRSRLAYAVSFGAGRSQLFIVDLSTGEVRSVPDSDGLAPLLWKAGGSQLLVAHLPDRALHWIQPD